MSPLTKLPAAAPDRTGPSSSRRPMLPPRRFLPAPAVVILAVAAAVVAAPGCKRNPRVVPVNGKVLYNGQPLPYGAVMFQPEKGQPAVGDVAADGTFSLSSYGPNDGAVPGRHAVSVSCYEGHRPGGVPSQGEVSMGRLLVPLKYTRLGSSGLSVEIKDVADKQPQDVVLELTGPPVTFR